MRVHRKILERTVSRAKIQKIPWIHGKLRIFPAAIEDSRNALGLRIRQRLQQNSINHAKNRAVSANAQSKGQNNGHGKCRTLAEHAHRVAQVFEKILQILCPAHIPARLLDLTNTPNIRDAASRASRAFIPAAMFSSTWRSKWYRISRSSSDSTRSRFTSERNLMRTMSHQRSVVMSHLAGGVDHQYHGAR